MFLDKLLAWTSKDLAMDLGTANTLIYHKRQGIVLNEPSVVALSRDNGRPVAVGHEAKAFLGRTPHKIITIRPLKDGVIADFDVTRVMIKSFLSRVLKSSRLIKPRLLIGVPTGITQVEKRAVIESAELAGAREIFLIEEPMAAAIGAGLPIDLPRGNMIVDIGGGTTEVAVISMSATAYSESIRVAGDETNESIGRYIQKKYQVLIGETTAEQIKFKIGSAFELSQPLATEFSGKDLVTGIPRTVRISDAEVREAIAEPVEAIVEAVGRAFEKTPPELVSDIYEQGIVMAGGGSLLMGLDRRLNHVTGVTVHLAEDPLTCVVMGAGIAMDDFKKYRQVFIN
ncbi:MAG: rod shape-determining protein [Proteobacteria bacterium]|nr:rod shape-determining protein [Pseudomonadota bacterium]MBU1740118.1 rod shape-determining protein [Pseudomonadota bacterium]